MEVLAEKVLVEIVSQWGDYRTITSLLNLVETRPWFFILEHDVKLATLNIKVPFSLLEL